MLEEGPVSEKWNETAIGKSHQTFLSSITAKGIREERRVTEQISESEEFAYVSVLQHSITHVLLDYSHNLPTTMPAT